MKHDYQIPSDYNKFIYKYRKKRITYQNEKFCNNNKIFCQKSYLV